MVATVTGTDGSNHTSTPVSIDRAIANSRPQVLADPATVRRGCLRSFERFLDPLIANGFVTCEGLDVVGYEGLDAVPQAPGDLAEWYPGFYPGRGAGMAQVVRRQRRDPEPLADA